MLLGTVCWCSSVQTAPQILFLLVPIAGSTVGRLGYTYLLVKVSSIHHEKKVTPDSRIIMTGSERAPCTNPEGYLIDIFKYT